MASDSVLRTQSLPVSADLSTRQFQFVSINSSGQLAVTADNAAADGVLLDNHADAQGKSGAIACTPGDIVRVAAGDTITAGDYLEVASGKAIKQTASNKIVAKALDSAVSGDNVRALLILQR